MQSAGLQQGAGSGQKVTDLSQVGHDLCMKRKCFRGGWTKLFRGEVTPLQGEVESPKDKSLERRLNLSRS